MASATAMIVVEDLVKRYPKNPVPAVDGVSFSVGEGEIFGLLGPNGAGKTTTVGVLTTRVRPTSGRAFVAGVSVLDHPVDARRQLAVVPQRNNLDRSLSIRDNLLFHAAYHGVPPVTRKQRADELLEQFGLKDRAGDKVDMFSGGQNQRAMIARALMHSPKVLFLDEPSTGLDPAARLFVWDRITELKAAGTAIMLTTHDMDEASTLADRVGIMDHGHILALDTPTKLTMSLPGSSSIDVGFEIAEQSRQGMIDALSSLTGVVRTEQVAADPGQAPTNVTRVRLYISRDAPGLIAEIAQKAVESSAALVDVKTSTMTLEDVFISLTGRALR